VGTLSVGAALYYLYDTYVAGKKVVSLAVLEASDDSTTNGIIAAFKNDATFVALAQAETSGILARDKEDGGAGVGLGVGVGFRFRGRGRDRDRDRDRVRVSETRAASSRATRRTVTSWLPT
jgi:hypothetical protein